MLYVYCAVCMQSMNYSALKYINKKNNNIPNTKHNITYAKDISLTKGIQFTSTYIQQSLMI